MDRVIKKEFAPWEETGISQEMVESTWEYCHGREREFNRYQVIDAEIYGPSSPIKNLLRAISAKYPLPNLDFIYYHADVLPLDYFMDFPNPQNAPICVSAKTKGFDRVILFIDWYCNPSQVKQGWNPLIEIIDKKQHRYPWEEKIEKLFWRGSPTDGVYTEKTWKHLPRGTLVHICQSQPELIDAGFVGVKRWQTDNPDWFLEEIGLVRFASPSQHLPYKYEMIIDGVTSTYPGTQWRLHSGCPPFKQMTDQIMWFSEELIPWTHYLPVEHDLSDLVVKDQMGEGA